jgi:DNA polymerase V
MTGDMEEGDLLVVDKSLTPKNGDIALCFLDGGFTVKRIKKEASKVYLLPTNAKFPVVEMQDGQELIVWGVVTYVIKKAKEL